MSGQRTREEDLVTRVLIIYEGEMSDRRKKYKSFLEDDYIHKKKNPRRNKYKIFLEDDEEEPHRSTSVRRNREGDVASLSPQVK